MTPFFRPIRLLVERNDLVPRSGYLAKSPSRRATQFIAVRRPIP